jgi:uncharacterized protein DUF4232
MGSRLVALGGATALVLAGCGVASHTTSTGSASAAATAVRPSPSPSPPEEPTPAGKPTITALGPIPWSSAVYNPAHPAPVPGTVADATVAWCTSQDLVATAEQFGGATQNAVGPLIVTNRGNRRCALQGSPTVAVEAADGKVVSGGTPSSVDTFVLHPWVELDPGASAVSSVAWFAAYCPSSPRGPYHLAASLPHAGGTVTETIGDQVPACPAPGISGQGAVTAGAFAAQTSDGSPVSQSPLADLTFLLTPPGTLRVRAGDTLRYDVTLTVAPSLPSLQLDPCLAYRESLADAAGATVTQELHLLNCAALPTIPAGSTVDYAMELRVPGNLQSGTTLTLSWETFMGKPAYGDATVVID